MSMDNLLEGRAMIATHATRPGRGFYSERQGTPRSSRTASPGSYVIQYSPTLEGTDTWPYNRWT